MYGNFSLHSSKHRSSAHIDGEEILDTTDYTHGEIKRAFRAHFYELYGHSEHHRGCTKPRLVNPNSKKGQEWLRSVVNEAYSELARAKDHIVRYTGFVKVNKEA